MSVFGGTMGTKSPALLPTPASGSCCLTRKCYHGIRPIFTWIAVLLLHRRASVATNVPGVTVAFAPFFFSPGTSRKFFLRGVLSSSGEYCAEMAMRVEKISSRNTENDTVVSDSHAKNNLRHARASGDCRGGCRLLRRLFPRKAVGW